MNRSQPGSSYQCPGEKMPSNAFLRGGYESFFNMFRPILSKPELFQYDLLKGTEAFQGKLLAISCECGFIGYDFQNQYHIPSLRKQTIHIKASKVGHNMLTLNPAWSIRTINEFSQ